MQSLHIEVRIKSQRNIARQLFGLTLTLVGLMSWNLMPIHLSERAVQAATRARVTEPTGQAVLRAAANGRIAFVGIARYPSVSSPDIYTMNPDGSDRKQLTFSQENEVWPVWSPDGTKIAFSRFYYNTSGIFVMNADGSDQRRLTQSIDDSSPTWSPDGTKIAFERRTSNIPGIFVMNADGSDQRAVASGFHGPAWSPDGLKLAVSSGAIYLINVDGSNRTQITQPTEDDSQPAWSPDGSKITFIRGTECFGGCDHQDIWVVNADGSNPTKLADSPAFTTFAWSPDGTRIIFGNGVDLFVMNPDGSGLTNITNTNDTNENFPSWQPISSSAVTSVSAASFLGGTIAVGSIVAAFGEALATGIHTATSIPLPLALAGHEVRVRDSAGIERLAPLFYVAPHQINYQIPLETTTGPALITVMSANGLSSMGTVQIAPTAPGLFAANSAGQGVAAALLFRVKADRSESYESVAQFDGALARFVYRPIDLGPATDEVFLLLFGTGIRFRSSLSGVSVTIGGTELAVVFAGAHTDYVGLDQITVRLSRALIGRGDVAINLIVDGTPANTVWVSFQ